MNQRTPFQLSRTLMLGCLLASAALNLSAIAAPHQAPQVSSHQQMSSSPIQPRAGGLEPGDYVDEASELEVMANQQQIPTAQLMSAAGHVVPDNFFLPGGSIPALYSRYPHQASQARARDLMAAASSQAEAGQTGQQQEGAHQFIDYNGYNLVAQPSYGRDQDVMVDLMSPAGQLALHQEQQQQQQQQHLAEQQLIAELQTIVTARQQLQQLHQQQQDHQQSPHQSNNHLQQHHREQTLDNSAQSSENSVVETHYGASSAVGPAYQVAGAHGYPEATNQEQKPFGLPTKSSSKEPSGMLKPLGNPKTVSSPAIDFVANNLPKTSGLEKLAEKIPQQHTPTVFSFSSNKDPMDKVKGVNQKKRSVMRQAEQFGRMLIKSVNDKFGTNIGDQTDIPFLLSSLGPLGFAQNLLFDPTLLVTLLNSAEKTYFSDVLPGPAKSAIRPVLNIFRVPNKKRDKANLLNVISYLTSVGQTPTTPKHRQGTGVEKVSKSKSRR